MVQRGRLTRRKRCKYPSRVRLPGRLVDHEKAAGRPAQGTHQAKLFIGSKVMNGQAAPRDVGRLRPAGHRLDEVAMVELDLERHVLEIVRLSLIHISEPT